MKIYRFPDHYEVVDGDTLYYVSYPLTSIRKLCDIDPRVWSPIGGALVQNPMKGLLYPIIRLLKNLRLHSLRAYSSVSPHCGAARQK